jgi:hypothetical protein
VSEQQVAEGFYKGCRGVLGSAQYAINPNNGNEQIAIDVHVPELERSFTTFLHFTEKAAPYAIERLRALGWTGDDISNLAGIDQNDVEVQIKYETFENKTRMKVDIVTNGGGRVKLENQMNEQQRRVFAARMKAFVKGASPNGGTSRPAPAASKREGAYDPGPPDDDLPF